jgi:hypothetical protein
MTPSLPSWPADEPGRTCRDGDTACEDFATAAPGNPFYYSGLFKTRREKSKKRAGRFTILDIIENEE